MSDLLCFDRTDLSESLSNRRTIDFASNIYSSTGDRLCANRSDVMLTVEEARVGKHDFLLTPCSAERFRSPYGHEDPHRGCFGNLATALDEGGVKPDQIPASFSVFMNVPVDGETGKLGVEPPLSKAGDFTSFKAGMDLVVALTACSAPLSNKGDFKPNRYEIIGEPIA
ncbi:DUF1989 domain-containing protein [Qipengyuania marisflavi]|uniref:DUF1989 domain-containing protein n=1 Tax=Qipengyuania marisflavi TaxID=2486356 RepID=UPI001FE422CA|nr:urea carboxylase-associated family protein [Qipengyuania marisflavi]